MQDPPFLKLSVTELPLLRLWNETGVIAAERIRLLSRSDLRQLVRTLAVRFVIADVGHPLQWHESGQCYSLWKRDIGPHLAEPDQNFRLEDFPGGFAYLASEWKLADGQTVVVLEKQH
jgi:hypothetical protein